MKRGDPWQVAFPSPRWLIPVILALVLSACVNTPAFKDDYELQSLLSDYQWRSAQIENEQQQKVLATIKRLVVTKSGSDYVVSADLDNAPVSVVVERILAQSGSAYDLGNVRLNGYANARFQKVPLLTALNQLINPYGVSVARQEGMLIFRRGIRATADGTANAGPEGDEVAGDSGTVYEVVPLRNLRVADAANLLRGLYNFENVDEPAITIGELVERSALYIGGAPRDVDNAIAVLAEADQAVPHVLIEALVVEYDVDALENLGTEISDAASGDFSNINLMPSQLGQNVVFTFLQGAANAAQLTAAVDLLVSIDKAQVLSRPYLAARSSQPAQIQVVSERFVAIQQNGEGPDITTTDSIDAGVTLDVRPSVLADDMIQLEMQVEESEFDPTVAGVLVQKARSTARSSMTVASGQTIVVGGLNRRRNTSGNAGFPKLRRLPIVGLLFSNETTFEKTTEVVIYLTPYVWTPGMGTPMPQPGRPQIRQGELSDVELQAEAHHAK
jgi:type II secretory pathway component GspD/PulD (secretin)